MTWFQKIISKGNNEVTVEFYILMCIAENRSFPQKWTENEILQSLSQIWTENEVFGLTLFKVLAR